MFHRGLPLRGLFLRVFFRHVMADHAAAHRADYGMMSRVMAGNAAHDRAFQTACGVGRSGGRERKRSEDGSQCDSMMMFHGVPGWYA